MTTLDLKRPSFIGRSPESDELREAVQKLWADRRIRRSVFIELFSKVPVAFGLMLGCYAAIMFGRPHGLLVVPLLGGIALGAIVMGGLFHDANHSATFTKLGFPKQVDKLFAWVVSDLMLGVCGYFWSWKHDLHHTDVNILHLDQDIRGEPLMRFHPAGKARSVYRYQHFYCWFLYPFMVFVLQGQSCRIAWSGGKYGPGKKKPSAEGWMLTGSIVGPITFYVLGLLVPIFVFGFTWYLVLLGFLAAMGSVGLAYALIFQFAHCNDTVAYATVEQLKNSPRKLNYLHQLQTTANFCPNNWLLAYVFGNLTHQNEHHGFRDYPHPFYRHMAPVLQRWCEKYAMPYNVKPTFRSALASHVRHLKKMGAQGRFVEIEMG